MRRIDWNVTARTNETYIREQIADHDLLGLAGRRCLRDDGLRHAGERQGPDGDGCRLRPSASSTARSQNRLGAVLVAGPHIHVMPPRAGQNQVRAILASLASAPPSEGAGPADLAGALDRVGAIANRRGFVAVVSDFAGDDWIEPLGRTGLRHELLAIVVTDPRELDVPPIGLVEFVDPATGPTAGDPGHRQGPASVCRGRRRRNDARRLAGLRRAHAEVIELSTADDWLGSIIKHVQRKRVAGRPRRGDAR